MTHPERTERVERLHDLLATRATEILSDAARTELEALLDACPDIDAAAYDLAASAFDLTRTPFATAEPLPASLRHRVDVDAMAWIARRTGLRLVVDTTDTPIPNASVPTADPSSRSRATTVGRWLPWFFAAACLALAVTVWSPPSRPDRTPSAAETYRALADRPDVIRRAWAGAAQQVAGDIVWDERTQSGVMRLRGLAPNDPRIMQYQLWIFDDARSVYSDATAVDGGVFDITETGRDLYVPFKARLPVTAPTLFAITTEPPGGVVRHNPNADPARYRIVLTAAVSG